MELKVLEWHPSLSTGISALDDQHRELFDLYNRLLYSFNENVSIEKFHEMIRTFLFYARWHFSEEELIMVCCRYPDYVDHKADHERLLQEATDFLETFGSVLRPEDGPAIVFYLGHWLTRHITQKDIALKKFIGRDEHALESVLEGKLERSFFRDPVSGANKKGMGLSENISREISKSSDEVENTCRSLVEFWIFHCKTGEFLAN